MSRIVQKDNFDREDRSENFILAQMSQEDAQAIADILNKQPDDTFYYKVVENDYRLYRFEP